MSGNPVAIETPLELAEFRVGGKEKSIHNQVFVNRNGLFSQVRLD